MAEGLVDGAAFAVDASLTTADANKQRSAVGSDDVHWEAIARTRDLKYSRCQSAIRSHYTTGQLRCKSPMRQSRRHVGTGSKDAR